MNPPDGEVSSSSDDDDDDEEDDDADENGAAAASSTDDDDEDDAVSDESEALSPLETLKRELNRLIDDAAVFELYASARGMTMKELKQVVQNRPGYELDNYETSSATRKCKLNQIILDDLFKGSIDTAVYSAYHTRTVVSHLLPIVLRRLGRIWQIDTLFRLHEQEALPEQLFGDQSHSLPLKTMSSRTRSNRGQKSSCRPSSASSAPLLSILTLASPLLFRAATAFAIMNDAKDKYGRRHIRLARRQRTERNLQELVHRITGGFPKE